MFCIREYGPSTASYISESELSAVGLNSGLRPTMHQTIESELSAVG